jgi:hypothetical protein
VHVLPLRIVIEQAGSNLPTAAVRFDKRQGCGPR